MKTSALLAVLGVVCVSIQEALSSGYNYAGPLQHRYVGPLASTIPAGVDGTITPVADTPEVAAARDAFFRAYRAQLAAVSGVHHAPATFVRPFVGPYSAPIAHYAHSFGAPVQGGDTPEVAAAKAEFFRLYNEMAAAAAAAPDYDTPHHY